MKLTIRTAKPSDIQAFVENNEPASVGGTAGDSWKKYQANNGGTGDTFFDLEESWLAAQGYSTYELMLMALGYVFGTFREKLRNWIASVTTPVTNYYLLENGTDKYVLEDGSGFYILE